MRGLCHVRADDRQKPIRPGCIHKCLVRLQEQDKRDQPQTNPQEEKARERLSALDGAASFNLVTLMRLVDRPKDWATYLYANIIVGNLQSIDSLLQNEVGDQLGDGRNNISRYFYRAYVHVVSRCAVNWTYTILPGDDLILWLEDQAWRFSGQDLSFAPDPDSGTSSPSAANDQGWKLHFILDIAELTDLGCHSSLIAAYKVSPPGSIVDR